MSKGVIVKVSCWHENCIHWAELRLWQFKTNLSVFRRGSRAGAQQTMLLHNGSWKMNLVLFITLGTLSFEWLSNRKIFARTGYHSVLLRCSRSTGKKMHLKKDKTLTVFLWWTLDQLWNTYSNLMEDLTIFWKYSFWAFYNCNWLFSINSSIIVHQIFWQIFWTDVLNIFFWKIFSRFCGQFFWIILGQEFWNIFWKIFDCFLPPPHTLVN